MVDVSVTKLGISVLDTENLRLKVVHKSALKNLRSLSDLCIETIALNMPAFCPVNQSNADPFCYLPPAVMTSLVQTLQRLDKLSGRYLPLLLTGRVDRVCLDLSFESKAGVARIMESIRHKCQKELKWLQLKVGVSNRPPRGLLQETLARLHGLQVLDFSSSSGNINDDVLATLGTNNEQLRGLDVRDNKGVTDKGIENLCVSDGAMGRCKSLAYLKLDGTSVTEDGLVTALENLPVLTNIVHKDCYKAVLRSEPAFREKTISALKLEELRVPYLTKEEFNLILELCPNMRWLFLKLNSVSITFDLSFDSLVDMPEYSDTPEFLMNLIMHGGSTISSLTLENKSEIDVSLIAHFCINLKELNFRCATSASNRYPITDAHFSQVNRFTICPLPGAPFPGEALKRLLCSQYLCSAIVKDVPDCSDDLIGSLLNNSDLAGKLFSNLDTIWFTYCPCLTGKYLKAFVCRAAVLSKLYVHYCAMVSPDDVAEVKDVISVFKLDMRFSYVK